jgi:hypothetical protein
MRIEGEAPEYLRGAVYDRYDAPHWVTTARGRAIQNVPATLAFGPGTSRLTLTRRAPVGEDMRWFLPVNACALGEPSGSVSIDAFGVARREIIAPPASITFRFKGCPQGLSTLAPPTRTELDVAPSLKDVLTPLAVAWTEGARTSHEKVEAIHHALRKLEYSLEVERHPALDPIVDFLTVHRSGHCEMFASSMALLLRTVEVPTRVVGGYLVRETNQFTGRAVVRDRNAHAWVEAWYDGAWHTWDPTPMSETFARRPTMLDHVLEAFSFITELSLVHLAKLGPLGISGILAALSALLLVVRWLGRTLQNTRSRASNASFFPKALPCFDALSSALATQGIARDAAEPIEAFARRLEALDVAWAHDAAEALNAYAAMRYGGQGDEAAITKSLERATRRIVEASPPA